MSQPSHSSPSSPAPGTDISLPPATQIQISVSPHPRAPPTPPPDSVPPSPRISAPAADFPAIPTTTTASESSSPSQSTLTTSFPSEGHPTFASVVSVSSLPTSVSSPAWFPPFDATPTSPELGLELNSPLVQSSSSATLVDSCFSPPSKSTLVFSPAVSLEISVHEVTHPELEEGATDVASDENNAQVLLKDLGLGLGLADPVAIATANESNADLELEPGQIIEDSPVLPSQQHQHHQQQTQTQTPPRTSPSPPCAPARPTIPLPPIDAESPHQFSSAPAPAPRQREDSASTRARVPSADAPPSQAQPSSVPVPAHKPEPTTAAPTSTATYTAPMPPTTTPASASADPDQGKTPNVYINGLPPNFPEDQLFALAAPFGEVRSVRSFTRHVGDAETGYGFVLFESISSAEKCINSLRRYRNLHPTFSKQVHKIPGTMYSQARPSSTSASDPAHAHHAQSQSRAHVHVGHGAAASTDTPSASSLAGWEQESAGEGSADSTFKAKMERLADKSSTNLYIEGLPLSIDEATLAALVSPYSIRSSRFFQTKLSSPPRIIAFVRLETRSAAEEIVERLHGRMVRGWNDPGSRISVRFADTSEQRELRRQERLAREGDQTSNQLSIAQATLLNLRGKELHVRSPMGVNLAASTHPDDEFGFVDEGGSEYSGSHYHHPFQSNAAYPTSDFEVDYSRVPAGRYPHALDLGAQQFPPSQQQQQQQQQQRMNPAMASLLDSLQASAFHGHDVYAPQDELSYRALQQQQHLASLSNTHAFGNARPFVPQGLGIGAPAQAHGGYTATEEFILRARSNSLPQTQTQKRRPMPLDLNLNQAQGQARHHELDSVVGMGVRGYRAQAATLSFPHHHQQQQQHRGHGHGLASMFDPQDSMNEEEFHAASSVPHHRPQQQQFDNGERIMNQLNAHSLHTNTNNNSNNSNTRLPRTQSLQQQQHLSASLRAPNQNQNHDFIPHARTQPPLAPNQQTHHYQHSLGQNSTAHSRNMTNIRPAQASNNNMMNTNSNHTSSSLGNSNGIYERNNTNNNDAREVGSRGVSHHQQRHNGVANSNGYSSSGSHSHVYSSHHHQHSHSQSDVDQSSPPLVSPALTYSSRSSVAAFSPTTPFFGSFDEGETTFRASPQMDVVVGKGKKSNSRTATR
ncbi:hypothetical protein C8F04DRAFT_1312235 [Mycena alexandri]|uniref:RRM domain-containing protein n=1 Tax=Mycena alexandri TaxID=1745969 RepID=A0AAD6S696_9AGAR|nr:hypothetical protein C8F04DRAFT_1312235 [Mycena alexandri]